MEYFSREYAPYPLSHPSGSWSIRATAAPPRPIPASIAYSESAGFLTDLSGWAPLDYATIHELAHQWWGGIIYGARMQGRQMLNETMAQYSDVHGVQREAGPGWLRQILAATPATISVPAAARTSVEQPLM